MHAYLRSLALGLALLLPAVPAFAADAPAQTDAAIPDKPTRITERTPPVAVEYEGNDSIGSRLATRVKETLNSSNLFSLTDKDTPKIRILIATQPEFKDRPGVGSAYAVVWVFSLSLIHILIDMEAWTLTRAAFSGTEITVKTVGLNHVLAYSGH